MKKLSVLMLGIVSIACFTATVATAAPENMAPGLWEITIKIDMPGMPAGAGTNTVRQCITQKDVTSGSYATPATHDKKCEVKDFKIEGNKSSWNMVCKGENAMTGSGSTTFNGNSYSGTMKMAMTHSGNVMNMTQVFTGKRIGDCK